MTSFLSGWENETDGRVNVTSGTQQTTGSTEVLSGIKIPSHWGLKGTGAGHSGRLPGGVAFDPKLKGSHSSRGRLWEEGQTGVKVLKYKTRTLWIEKEPKLSV